jgi:hypothetical protein
MSASPKSCDQLHAVSTTVTLRNSIHSMQNLAEHVDWANVLSRERENRKVAVKVINEDIGVGEQNRARLIQLSPPGDSEIPHLRAGDSENLHSSAKRDHLLLKTLPDEGVQAVLNKITFRKTIGFSGTTPI